MNAICEYKYSQFRNILSGCRSILDAYYFADLYTKHNPEMKSIVYSMVNGKRYEEVLDFKTVQHTIEDINNAQYQENANIVIEKISKNTVDSTQSKTFNRIAKNKPSKPIILVKEDHLPISYIKCKHFDKINDNLIEKKCPHCNHDCKVDGKTTYVICGYSDSHSGYDWEGCGKDWCFQCGKILCKQWEMDSLFVKNNRIHNDECCKQHATENNKNYPNDYCQCNNKYVKRILC